jgi:hypothetical protein
MNLVWSNEFNNPDISSASWNFEQGDGCPNFYGLGNNEVEFYQTKNASVVDATLMIESRRECRVIRDQTCWRKTTKGKRFFLIINRPSDRSRRKSLSLPTASCSF